MTPSPWRAFFSELLDHGTAAAGFDVGVPALSAAATSFTRW
jgi:hypothetical protein